ncbi:2-aminoethanethiol dioxygenase-like [Oppia nitens]|uniref:2-aminoethanethiol dioxygenase-like n=1 Tax=Oppia nitens TaxID=1686743 RepID=UPI0023DBF8C8|nr:2-aminoethanethiol dioxygenase-like [Oppia nitens]
MICCPTCDMTSTATTDEAMVQPMAQSVARLAQMTFTINRLVAEDVFNESLNKLKKLLSQMTHKDINLDKELMNESLISRLRSRRCSVTFVPICETQHFQMCCFALRTNRCRIPLHNHPQMFGLIKVIYGCVSVDNYTALPVDGKYILPNDVSKRVERWQRDFLVPVIYNGKTTIDSQSKEVCVLTPNQRNYHEVVAIDGPAVILDILGPPYREDRECHYYKVVTTVYDHRLQRDITWLLELEDPPEDYRCDSLPYMGPNIYFD